MFLDDTKIIQILPAPSDLYINYIGDPEGPFKEPALCIGLTNKGEVLLLDIDDEGQILPVLQPHRISWEKRYEK